jgi:PAS domain S-box-containing protein
MEDQDKTKVELVKELTELRRASELRQSAEKRLRGQSPEITGTMTAAEVSSVVHELQVHQIELEMQNDEFMRVQVDLRESAQRYGKLFDFAPIGYFAWNERGEILEVNLAGANLLDIDRSAVIRKRFGQYVALEDRAAFSEFLHHIFDADAKQICELELLKGENRIHVLIEAVTIRDSQGVAKSCLAAVMDITARKKAEEALHDMERRFLHAQKLESLGILAGGIAHDFNNILAGIMGYADLAKIHLPASSPAREDLEIIKKTVERAAHLTRQMLAYSGKGKFLVEAVSLTQIVEEMRAMLEMAISKKAVLNCNLSSELPMIEADASQIHQIILNLVINASEAIGERSGVITISTDAVHCNAADCAALGDGLQEGHYVRLEVTDTGCGMDEDTLAKIFDPFFTTKYTGRGLGLAAAHGILRGHQGGIQVASKLGQGTKFSLFFPAAKNLGPASAGERHAAKPWHGSGTVLIVDDEELIRNLARRMVQEAGFSVLTADDGEMAVQLFREHQAEIACVLLDLKMPKMNGEEAFRVIRQISSDARVLLSSGYSEEYSDGRFAELGLAGFIQKPYQFDKMIASLRAAVEGN